MYPHLSAEEKEFNRQKASAMSKKFGFVTDLTSLVVTTDPLPAEEGDPPPSSPPVLIPEENNQLIRFFFYLRPGIFSLQIQLQTQ
jgi:hypothetical protein